MSVETEPLDVWLAFDHPEDEEASHEANTFATERGFVVEWYHTAVGLVTERWFPTYEEACAWLEACGYQDFTA